MCKSQILIMVLILANKVTVREHQAGHAGLVPGNAADAEVKLAAVIGVGVLGEGAIRRRALELL